MQLNNRRNAMKKHETGAVVIEATLALTVFMFFVVTILSIVNICILQQKVGLALNEAAREIAQYSYIYSLSGANDIQKGNYENAEMAREDINTVVDGVSNMYENLSGFANGDASFNDASEKIINEMEIIEKTITDAAGKGADWIISFLRVVGNEAGEEVKGRVCGALAKGLMQKNLVGYSGGSADSYLKKLGIEKGIDGLDLSDSVFMLNGSREIILVADYQVKVITLLNHDITLHFRQAAITRAWEASQLESGIVKGDEKKPEEPKEPEQEDDVYEFEGHTVVNGLIDGKFPIEEYIDMRIASVKQGKQGDEDHLFVLGQYGTEHDYIELAEQHGAFYFDMGEDWERIKREYNYEDEDMFRLFIAPAIDEAISSGKIMVYSHNPEEAPEGSGMCWEWKYMQEKYGYSEMVKDRDGDFWYPK